MFNCKEAHLGLATTRELLIELEARGRTETRPHLVSDAERLEHGASELLSELRGETLNYRTAGDE